MGKFMKDNEKMDRNMDREKWFTLMVINLMVHLIKKLKENFNK